MLVGDFNTEITEHYIESFLYEHELNNLVKEKNCFKNVQNSSCTNVLKTSISKGNPRQITYRDYKRFDSLKFNNQLKNVLTIENIDNCTLS